MLPYRAKYQKGGSGGNDMIASSGHGHRHRHRFIVRFVLPCCGFFLLRCRVDSFHSAAQCRPCCFPLLWILSTSEPCGFFPLGGSSLSCCHRP